MPVRENFTNGWEAHSQRNTSLSNDVVGNKPDEISLVPETPSTLGALVGFLLWRWRNICWVVIKVLMPLQQLLLSKALVALVTLERFLVCVYQHVRLKVTLGDGRVRAEITFETFLPFVSFLVNFQCIPVREGFSTHFAVHWPLTCVQLLNVQPQIRFPPARGWT